MISRIKNFYNEYKALNNFLFKALVFYVVWIIVYDNWLHPQGNFDRWMIDNLIHNTRFILTSLNYQLIPLPNPDDFIRTVGIDGSHGVWVGDPCNGLTLIALFTGFVIAYPGKLIHKIWFITLGNLFIHFMNVIRISALCIVLLYYPESLDFNHTYTFTIMVYSIVFGLWILWANKFSKL